MPNQQLSEMAIRFSNYHNATLAALTATQETTMTKNKTAVKARLAKALGRPLTEKVGKTKNIGRKKAAATATRNARTGIPKEGRKAQVITLMKRPAGVTVEQITKATGMLAPSARALICGIAKTETIGRTKDDGKPTVYRIG